MSRRVLVIEAFSVKGLPYSRQHIDRKIRAGTFPAPFKLPGSTRNFWFEDVIDAYLEASAAGRDWRKCNSDLNKPENSSEKQT